MPITNRLLEAGRNSKLFEPLTCLLNCQGPDEEGQFQPPPAVCPPHHHTSQTQTDSLTTCTIMATVNTSELSSTDSYISFSDLNQPDFDTPLIPMSEFKYVEDSTLPAKPWPEPRKRAQTESVMSIEAIMKRPHIDGPGLFPDTPEFLAYMQKLRDAGRDLLGSTRGRRVKPTSHAPLRRSERIATLNARREEQELFTRTKESNKVAKKRQQPSTTTGQKGRRAVQKKRPKKTSRKTASISKRAARK